MTEAVGWQQHAGEWEGDWMSDVVSIGEVLFDVFGELELLAGAPLNVAVHLHRLGHAVDFLSAVGTDAAGDRALQSMADLGMRTGWVERVAAPTGRVEVRLEAGEPTYTILPGAAYGQVTLQAMQQRTLEAAKPAWVYYGTLAQCSPVTHATTMALLQQLPETRRFYDVNLRPGFADGAVVLRLLEVADVVKLNEGELSVVTGLCGWPALEPESACRALLDRFGLRAVCVTHGERGASLLQNGEFVQHRPPRVAVADTVGAGDAFAAALLHGLLLGWPPDHMIRYGNQLGSYVASQRGALPPMVAGGVYQMQPAA